MKTFSLSLSLLVFSSVSLAARANPEEGWWFRDDKKSVQQERSEIESVPSESVPTQPTLLTESKSPSEITAPTQQMQPHPLPSDPRQLPHDPCPPCGMG